MDVWQKVDEVTKQVQQLSVKVDRVREQVAKTSHDVDRTIGRLQAQFDILAAELARQQMTPTRKTHVKRAKPKAPPSPNVDNGGPRGRGGLD